MLLEKLRPLKTLVNEHQSKSLLLIAIDGPSAAGKSTLASAINSVLPKVTIVHMDDFYRVLDEETRVALNAKGGYDRYYDWERLETQVIKPLSTGKDSRYQKYDWMINRLGEWLTVQATGIIVIEGCYAARPELRPYYDIVLFVETSAARRLQRQQERADATASWLARWDAAEQFYIQHDQPHHYADLVIAGE